MWGTVLLMGLIVGLEPEYARAIQYILPRSSPLYRLVAFYVSGFVTSLAIGSLIVFVFGHITPGNTLTLSPFVKTITGGACLLLALLFGTGVITRLYFNFRTKRPPKSAKQIGLERIPGFNKLPAGIKEALQNDAPLVAWTAGIYVGIPGAYYLAAIAVILSSNTSRLVELAALLVFNIIAFVLVESVIVAMIFKPGAVQQKLNQLHRWIKANNRSIITLVFAVVGIYLILMGITQS